MNESKRLMTDLIEAVEQERLRIEEPKNRPRYFIFGKLKEHQSRKGYSVIFQNAPDRVHRDALWATRQGKVSLFRVGDIFISGTMRTTHQGLEILFSTDDITKLNTNTNAIKRITDFGIDYIMDNRELVEQLLSFLEFKADFENSFLSPLIHDKNPVPMHPVGRFENCSDLNLSQQHAIRKALSQKVTFIWGPPGTGKTKTMAALADTLIKNKKRVLLASLSNMALDQLLLATLDYPGFNASNISIARLGSTMGEETKCFSRSAFEKPEFATKRAGMRWKEHVKYARLVAGNFAMLTFPRAADPGQFDYVIADEVSMTNIPSLVAASFFAKTGFVVGGDPAQLPPIFPEDAEEPNEWFRNNIFKKADITRRDDTRAAFLDTQYRMQHEICDLVSDLFYKDVDGLKTGIEPLPPIGGFGSRVSFIQSLGEVERFGTEFVNNEDHRRFNEVHAKSAVNAVSVALKRGVKASDIGIIAPYNAQVVQISQKLRELSEKYDLNLDELKVSTVHSFQGQERRVIIVDFTDDNVQKTHLTTKRELINVALSRAKEQLIIVGNYKYLTDAKYFEDEEIELFQMLLNRTKKIKEKK